ncbi:MAG: hypothetical protein JWN70_5109 [Planctomycetaceae bacterium]|nr:hypothetical protein [Planctomycetaceae bacterium]
MTIRNLTAFQNCSVTLGFIKHTYYLVEESRHVSPKLWASWLIVGGVLLGTIAGCGGSDSGLAPVRGRVRLNGEPLADAIVEFQPDGKSPSVGTTDEDGNFQLQFSKNRWGAVVGSHRVKIDHDVDGREGRASLVRIPPRYNVKSELQREVVSGSNSFEFDLKTDLQTASSN